MNLADLYMDDTAERQRRKRIADMGQGLGVFDDPRENDEAKKALDETYRATGQEHLASDYVPPDAKAYADAPSFTLPGSPDRSAPQGTAPTAQIEYDPDEGRLGKTATAVAESAPGRFLGAAAKAVPQTLENVATVAGMIVGAPLVTQGAKAIPGLAAGAAGAAARGAANPLDFLRRNQNVAPVSGALGEAVVLGEAGNPITGGPAGEALAAAGPVAALEREVGPMWAQTSLQARAEAFAAKVAGGGKKAASLLDRYGNAIDNSAEALAAEEAHAQSVLERLRAKSEALREQAPPRSPEELFREGLRDEREAQSRYESFRGRLDEAHATAQSAAPPPSPTIDAAFSDPTDQARAATRASTLDLGDGGPVLMITPASIKAAVDPIRRLASNVSGLAKKGVEKVDEVINTNYFVDQARKGVHFLEDKVSEYGVGAVSPKLKKFMSSAPTVELDRFRSMTHSKQNSYLLTAQENGVAATSDITKDEYGPITDYLRTSNFKARLDSGIDKLPGGMTPADVDMALMDSSSKLSPQRLRELEGKYRAYTDSIGDRAEAVGILEPGQRRVDYMPHLVRKFFKDEPQVSSAAVGSLFTKPGFTKTAKGSMAEIESDPYKAAVFVDYMTGRAEAMKEFVDEVGRHSINAEIRAGTREFNPETDALFAFSPSGRSQAVTDADAEYTLARLRDMEPTPSTNPNAPFPEDPSVNSQIKGYLVVPKELAEGAAEYDTNANRLATGVFGKAVAKTLDVTASIARDMQLVWSLPFQAGQWPADLSTVLHNVPVHMQKGVIKDFGKNVKMLMDEYAKIRGGGKSDIIAQLRKDGYLTDIAETLVDTNLGGVISEHAIAKQHRAQPQGVLARLKEGYRNAKEPLIELGQVREGAAKLALGKAFEEMGLDPKGAVYLANDRTGGYYHRSAWGKLASKLVLNSKWYSTQVERLTRDIAKNARTGRSDLTGLLEGPAPKIAASQLLIYAANHRDEKTTAAYDRLPLYKKGSLIIYVDEDGDAITATPDTLGNLATSIYETARGLDADPAGTASQLADSASGRANPLVKIGNEVLNPGPVPRDEKNKTDEDLRALNWKQGGLPIFTPKTQRTLVTPFTGWPGRFVSDVVSRDMSAEDKAIRVMGDLALPVPGIRVNRVRRDAGMAQLMAMNSDKLKSAIINAANGETEEDAAQLEKLTEVYFQGGFGSEADWKRLVMGAEAGADELENLNSDERKDMTRARLGELDPQQFEALKYRLSDLYK